MIDITKYLRIPYKSDGQGVDGANCWALVGLFYRDEFGIELPRYGVEGDDLRAVAHAVREHIGDGWTRRQDGEQPESGDVVSFAPDLAQYVTHVGVYVGELLGHRYFLHVRKGLRASMERLDGPMWRESFRGFYRRT